MATGEITKEVEQLIREKLRSVEQLEVLLFLRAAADKEWSATEVSEKLYTQPDSAAKCLADLSARGLLVVRRTPGPLLYRYKPNTAALERTVSGLADAYKVRRFSVIELIFSSPNDQIQVFSDAFRIRKED